MPAPIRFCFDYLSPYAYIAWTQIHAIAERHGREVEPWPTLFAALLAHAGTRGPAEIPAKKIYVIKDTTRTARALGLPFAPPPTHPFNPLLALRVSSLPTTFAERRRVVDALFAATWGGGTAGTGVDRADTIVAALGAAGFDGAELVARAAEPAAKDALRAQTTAAIDAGAFGVPTMFVDHELFWGVDSLPHLDRFLAGDDPITVDDLARWIHVTPSATRRL